MALLYYYYFSFLMLATTTHELVQPHQDLHSLLSFKSSADPLNTFLHTWDGLEPCSGSWIGVKCNRGRVVSIYLDNASLTGSVSTLLGLRQLQVLSLRRNALNGSLPHLTDFENPRLKHLFLSHNHFSGILSFSLPSLLSLRVEHNDFSGALVGLQLPIVEDFNVSENCLSGEISPHFSRFPSSAFIGNPALCGSPLPSCEKTSQMFTTTNTTSTDISPSPTSLVVSPCSRISLTKLGTTAVLAVGIGNIVVISMALVFVIGMYMWFTKKNVMSLHSSTSVERFESEHGRIEEEKKNGGLVCFGGEDLRLECLLKASAEILGKGVVGSTYKAILDDGLVVAVKRLSSVRFPSKIKNFDRHMHLMGRVKHCNVASLRAYCNAHEEKLLVYDYMPNGSLHSLLYRKNRRSILRNRGLDWRSRKHILMGAAQGLHFIHTFPARPPLVHANIKPSNILIDEQGNASISEWGLMVFANNTYPLCPPHSSTLFSSTINCPTTPTWHGYRAPEISMGDEKATQESDVYSFGMVLLEVVTDKEMDDAECEGEMMGMVKIGMMCTKESPEERPKMSQVVSMMNEMF